MDWNALQRIKGEDIKNAIVYSVYVDIDADILVADLVFGLVGISFCSIGIEMLI